MIVIGLFWNYCKSTLAKTPIIIHLTCISGEQRLWIAQLREVPLDNTEGHHCELSTSLPKFYHIDNLIQGNLVLREHNAEEIKHRHLHAVHAVAQGDQHPPILHRMAQVLKLARGLQITSFAAGDGKRKNFCLLQLGKKTWRNGGRR